MTKPLHPSRIVDIGDKQRILDDTGRWVWFDAGSFYPSHAEPTSALEGEIVGLKSYTRVNPAPADVPPSRERDWPPYPVRPEERARVRDVPFDPPMIDRMDYVRYEFKIDTDIISQEIDQLRRRYNPFYVDNETRRALGYRPNDPDKVEKKTKKVDPPKITTEDDRIRIMTKMSLLWDKHPEKSFAMLFFQIGRSAGNAGGTNTPDDIIEAAIDRLMSKR